jgi:hypothetical protein
MLEGSDQYIKPINAQVTTYCIQRSTPDVVAPVHLDEVGAEVFRYIGIRIWTITVRRDATQKKGKLIAPSKYLRGNIAHYFRTLIPASSFFFKRSVCTDQGSVETQV